MSFVVQSGVERVIEDHDDPGRNLFVARAWEKVIQLEFCAEPSVDQERLLQCLQASLTADGDMDRWVEIPMGAERRFQFGVSTDPDLGNGRLCEVQMREGYTWAFFGGPVDVFLQCWDGPESFVKRFVGAFMDAWYGKDFVENQISLRTEQDRKLRLLNDPMAYFDGLFSRDVM